MRLLTAFPYKERAGGAKGRRGRRDRERGNMRRYYERQQGGGGGEKFGRRDKDRGIKADKAAAQGDRRRGQSDE